MQTLIETLEDVVREEKYRGRYDGDVVVEEFDETPRFSGETHLITKDITTKYNPEYESQHPGKTVIVVRDINRHEINHHKYNMCIGCPQTVEKHVELFYEPIFDVLSKRGFSNADTTYITNVLEDTLLHLDLHKNEQFALDGIAGFFDDVGRYTQKNNLGKIKFTQFYEAHVKLNMCLWGNSKQKKLLKKYYTHDKKVTDVLTTFLDRTKQYNFLNEDHWKNISTIYAEEFSKLMTPNYAQITFNHSGSKTKGRESEKKSDGKEQEGNIFDKEMQTKQYKKSRVQKAYYSDDKVPGWMNSYDALDILYESLAQKLDIKAKTYTQEEQLPIVWYGKRDFNSQKDNLKHITFGINENGTVGLKKKVFHEDLPIQVKHRPESFPRLRFGIIDTSYSMKKDVYDKEDIGSTKIIPWGDKSKYHYALLGWYGFLEYLKSNHLLIQDSVDLANFSIDTIVGKGLCEAKKVALTPQFKSTSLEMSYIKHFFEGSDNLIFTISDGDIGNWSSIKDEFILNAKKHNYFHIQIGKDNSTTQDLEKAGLHVVKVMGNEDLAQRVIDLSDKMFRKE